MSDLLIDDIPVRDIPQSNIGLQQLSQLLHLQATAIAFCRGAHLSTLKKYVHRFLAHASQRFDSESGLRPPNVSELQLADQVLWGKIATINSGPSMTRFTNLLNSSRYGFLVATSPICALRELRRKRQEQRQRQW